MANGKRDRLKSMMSANKTEKDDYTPVDDIDLGVSNLSNVSYNDVNNESDLSFKDISDVNDLSDENISYDNTVNDETICLSNDNLSYNNDINKSDLYSSESNSNLNEKDLISNKSNLTLNNSNLSNLKKMNLLDRKNYQVVDVSDTNKDRKVKYTLGILPNLKTWFSFTAASHGISSNKYAELLIKQALEDNVQMTIEEMVQVKSENKGNKPLCSFYLEEEIINAYKKLAAKNGLTKTELINYLIREEMNCSTP